MSPGSTSASADLLSRRVGFCCRELQGVSTTLGELLWLYCESCEPWFEVTVMETKHLAAFWSLPYSCNWQTQRLVLKMTTAQVVETSVTVNNNSPIQNYTHPDDQTQPSYEMTPGFKPFTDLFFHEKRLKLLLLSRGIRTPLSKSRSLVQPRPENPLLLWSRRPIWFYAKKNLFFALATKAFLNGNTDTAYWRKLYLMKALRNWVTVVATVVTPVLNPHLTW